MLQLLFNDQHEVDMLSIAKLGPKHFLCIKVFELIRFQHDRLGVLELPNSHAKSCWANVIATTNHHRFARELFPTNLIFRD